MTDRRLSSYMPGQGRPIYVRRRPRNRQVSETRSQRTRFHNLFMQTVVPTVSRLFERRQGEWASIKIIGYKNFFAALLVENMAGYNGSGCLEIDRNNPALIYTDRIVVSSRLMQELRRRFPRDGFPGVPAQQAFYFEHVPRLAFFRREGRDWTDYLCEQIRGLRSRASFLFRGFRVGLLPRTLDRTTMRFKRLRYPIGFYTHPPLSNGIPALNNAIREAFGISENRRIPPTGELRRLNRGQRSKRQSALIEARGLEDNLVSARGQLTNFRERQLPRLRQDLARARQNPNAFHLRQVESMQQQYDQRNQTMEGHRERIREAADRLALFKSENRRLLPNAYCAATSGCEIVHQNQVKRITDSGEILTGTASDRSGRVTHERIEQRNDVHLTYQSFGRPRSPSF